MSRKMVPFLVVGSMFAMYSVHADGEIVAAQPVVEPVVKIEKTETPTPTPTPVVHAEVKPAAPFASFTGRIKRNKVRMRAHANLDSAVIRETNGGDLVAVVGEEKDFYKVQPSRNIKGYVFRTFILDNIVEADRVNIRLSPDVESPSIGQLHTGEKVNAVPCEGHTKWFEIALPSTLNFYIAKEYIENIGGLEIVMESEAKKEQAYHLLNAAFLHALAEIQKPFDEISMDQLHEKFNSIIAQYSDLNDVVAKAKEADVALEEAYVQKRIAHLEAKTDQAAAARQTINAMMQKLAQIGREIKGVAPTKEQIVEMGKAASDTLGHTTVKNDTVVTDKMLVWQSMEDSLYHLWASTHDGKSQHDFYEEESTNATVLTGIIEPFNRPVKNRPGDYILRTDNLPVAFLYSTKINLQDLVGKKVTLVTTSRPNNNFAFPAYFVLSAE